MREGSGWRFIWWSSLGGAGQRDRAYVLAFLGLSQLRAKVPLSQKHHVLEDKLYGHPCVGSLCIPCFDYDRSKEGRLFRAEGTASPGHEVKGKREQTLPVSVQVCPRKERLLWLRDPSHRQAALGGGHNTGGGHQWTG